MSLSSIREAYESALLDNSAALTTVESTLRNVSWFLPGRFKDAELASEGSEWEETTGSLPPRINR